MFVHKIQSVLGIIKRHQVEEKKRTVSALSHLAIVRCVFLFGIHY